VSRRHGSTEASVSVYCPPHAAPGRYPTVIRFPCVFSICETGRRRQSDCLLQRQDRASCTCLCPGVVPKCCPREVSHPIAPGERTGGQPAGCLERRVVHRAAARGVQRAGRGGAGRAYGAACGAGSMRMTLRLSLRWLDGGFPVWVIPHRLFVSASNAKPF